jgi:hypothetical protein
MRNLIKLLILLFGVSIYGQDTLSVKDGAYGYEKDFVIEIDLKTETKIRALQFDLNWDGQNFTYLSSYTLNKDRLGGDDSDHVLSVKKVNDSKLRFLIYSPSNLAIPTSAGNLLKVDFKNSLNFGDYGFDLSSVVASKEDNSSLDLKLENGKITTLAPRFYSTGSGLFDMGSIYIGSKGSANFTLRNDGNSDLTISEESNDLVNFTMTAVEWPKVLAANEELSLTVEFEAKTNGTFEEKFTLKTDDPLSKDTVHEFIFKAVAYNENKLVVERDVVSYNDQEAKVKVGINGDEDITSFQFDIHVDFEEIKLIDGSAKLLITDTDHVITSKIRENDEGETVLRVLSYSPTNATFKQPIGNVAEFSVIPSNLDPGSYNLNISNPVLTDTDLVNVTSSVENGSLDLRSGKLSFIPESEYNMGDIFLNSYNIKKFSIRNSGNLDLKILTIEPSDPDLNIVNSTPIDISPNQELKIDFSLIPSKNLKDYKSYIKFHHNGGKGLDSILVSGNIISRNEVDLQDEVVIKGETNNLPLSLLNSNDIKGLQFDLNLPAAKKSFTWTLTADSNSAYNFQELDGAANPGITHYVGDDIKFINNAGSTHPLFIVSKLNDDGGYSSENEVEGVQNQGATSGEVIVDLSKLNPGTYYYICGNHKDMQGVITVKPKFSISINKENLNTERANDFNITQSSLGPLKYRFLLYSDSNAIITGNKGVVLNIPLALGSISNSAMDFVDGSYEIGLENIIISGSDNTDVGHVKSLSSKIVISDENLFDPVVDPNQSVSLKENPVSNTIFYKITASDSDTYSIIKDFKIVSGNIDESFGIFPNSGELYVNKAENIDYEKTSSYNIGVTVSDGTKTSVEEIVVVNITDDPNAYVVDNFTVRVYRDTTKAGVANPKVTTYASSENAFSYKIDGGADGDLFNIDFDSGLISFINPPVFSTPLDSDSDNVYEFKVRSIVKDDTSDDFPTISSEKTISSVENKTDILTVTSILSTIGSDYDGDGILDPVDNCPTTFNPDQADTDGNGEGDVCEDSDGDGILDFEDNCIFIPNPDQADADGDGEGDVCEDADADGIIDSKDNCINTPNIDQADSDGDGIGDVCDDDRDGDGVLNTEDDCPDSPGTAETNGCPDSDGDGVINKEDNCPDVANSDQADSDGDGIGDVCDDDRDGDGILNSVDTCPDSALGVKVDVTGCAIFTLPLDNNKVSVTSSTCIGNTDGSIGLSVEDASYTYSVTVTGQDDPITLGGETKTASVTGLGKGTYTVCFTVEGQDGYEQCFEVNIGEPKALSAFIDIDNDNKTTSIQLSGSSSYNVEVNGERYDVKGDRFTTNLPTGLSIIKISTDLDCQGIIEREVFISEDIHYYPNPTQTDVNVHVSGEDTMVQVSVFSEKGDLIYTREQQIQDFSRKTNIDLSRQITGTYIVVMDGPTVRKTFKIVKR